MFGAQPAQARHRNCQKETFHWDGTLFVSHLTSTPGQRDRYLIHIGQRAQTIHAFMDLFDAKIASLRFLWDGNLGE